jgi:hypothetical protein
MCRSAANRPFIPQQVNIPPPPADVNTAQALVLPSPSILFPFLTATGQDTSTVQPIDYFSAKTMIDPVSQPTLGGHPVKTPGIFDFVTKTLAAPVIEGHHQQIQQQAHLMMTSATVNPLGTTTMNSKPMQMNSSTAVVAQQPSTYYYQTAAAVAKPPSVPTFYRPPQTNGLVHSESMPVSSSLASSSSGVNFTKAMTREERRRLTNRMASRRYRERKRLEREAQASGAVIGDNVSVNTDVSGNMGGLVGGLGSSNASDCSENNDDRRHKNRLASSRYRDKQRSLQLNMESEVAHLSAEIATLEEKKQSLMQEIDRLQSPYQG